MDVIITILAIAVVVWMLCEIVRWIVKGIGWVVRQLLGHQPSQLSLTHYNLTAYPPTPSMQSPPARVLHRTYLPTRRLPPTVPVATPVRLPAVTTARITRVVQRVNEVLGKCCYCRKSITADMVARGLARRCARCDTLRCTKKNCESPDLNYDNCGGICSL